jgi:hypothetical protein
MARGRVRGDRRLTNEEDPIKIGASFAIRYSWVVAAVLKYNAPIPRQRRPSDPNDHG